MNLTKTKQLLEKYNIKLAEKYDQHFLMDEQLIDKIVETAQVNKLDVIVEIGPGIGNLTKKLAQKAKKVIAVELDERFKPILEKLPENVEVIFGDAMKFLSKRKVRDFNKIVANIPYQMGEPLMHYLNFARHIELTVLTLPKKFVDKMKKNPIFSAFLIIEEIKEVPKDFFYPVPRINSMITSIKHKTHYEEDKDENSFIRRKLYMQEDKKLKNGLRDAIIDLYILKHQKQLTKKEANKIIISLNLDPKLLEINIKNIPIGFYIKIANKIEKLDI